MSQAQALPPVDPRMPSPPRQPLPAGACDTHTHVFGPYDVFPFVTPSSYAPPLAPFDRHAEMLDRIGAERVVLVQPAPYAHDHRALVDALRRYGGRARGIATVTDGVEDDELDALHAAGVRGVRFAEVLDRGTGRRFAGSVGIDHLGRLASRLRDRGWHAQVWARCADVPACVAVAERAGVPVVFEHMGMVDVALGPAHDDVARLIELVRDGRAWVKLAVCRNSTAGPAYPDLRPFHEALVAANPARLLWASDWPFVRMGDASPDVGRLIDLFDEWVADASVRHGVLVANPAALYGFQA